MTRETRTGVVLAVAIGVAGLASYGVYRAIQNMPVKEVEVGKAVMVIARQSLPVGTMVTSDNVKVVPWPSTTPIRGSFDTIDKVVNRGLVERVMENEPITESKLAPKDAGAGLPPLIPNGMRAVSIRVNEVVGVAGFVFPGSRVDVLATVTLEDRQSISKVVLSDVQVLTAGTRYDQDQAKQEGKPVPSTVVTLAVSPADAERVTLAQEKGRLMLALRNPLDAQPAETSGVKMAGLVGNAPPPAEPKPPVKRASAPKAAPPPPPPPAPAAPTVYTVEAYRAGKTTQEVVR